MKLEELDEIQAAVKECMAAEMLVEGDVESLPPDANPLKLLDSFGITTLVVDLEERFDISIGNHLLVTENLESIDALARMVKAQIDAKG